MTNMREPERVQVVIIGGGQAGLSVGYRLARRGIPFVILDANARIGDAWRHRWDSLKLFSPALYDGLEGMRFPDGPLAFPTKDEMANYLEAYAARFGLPVRSGTHVDRLSKEGGRYLVAAGDRRWDADQVVVAMGNFQEPRVPAFAPELAPGIVQMHSSEYRRPEQLREGGVLVVGAGNSGAEIAKELIRGRPTWLSGPDVGAIPFRHGSVAGRYLFGHLLRFVGHYVLTVDTPMGRKARPKLLRKTTPLIRVKPDDLTKAGVERVPRVTGVKDGRPLLDDGRVLDVANVIWCTGYHPGFSWIDLPVFGPDGAPMHDRGVAVNAPGLYFVGLHFLYAMTSAVINGVGRDAERIVEAIAAAAPAARPARQRAPVVPAATQA